MKETPQTKNPWEHHRHHRADAQHGCGASRECCLQDEDNSK